ncbi:MAG: efflux RND transporter periplasmic adaptor subunit [Candidatus Cryptobacteroides sp.]
MKKKVLILSLLLLTFSCKGPENEYKRRPVEVKVMELKREDRILCEQYVGEIEARNSSPITSLTGGEIVELAVKNGDYVLKGQVILKLDDAQARSALASAEATYRQALDAYNRTKKIYSKGGSTEVQMIEMETKLEQAKAMKSIAEKKLADYTVKAACEGTINGMEVAEGQNILPGIRIGSIIDLSEMDMVIQVPEAKIAQIREGDRAKVRFPVHGDKEFSAAVREKSLTADKIGHLYRLTLSLQESPEIELIPGMIGKVYMEKTKKSGFVVPPECISRFGNSHTVWIVEGNRAERREVSVGEYAQGGIIIKSGLNEGEKIIVSGSYKLYHGAEIRVAE